MYRGFITGAKFRLWSWSEFHNTQLPQTHSEPLSFLMLFAHPSTCSTFGRTRRRTLLCLFHLTPMSLHRWFLCFYQAEKIQASPPGVGDGVFVGGRGRRQSPVVTSQRKVMRGREGALDRGEHSVVLCWIFHPNPWNIHHRGQRVSRRMGTSVCPALPLAACL